MTSNTGESQWLIQKLSADYSRRANNDEAKIKLNQLVSKLGFFYEKMRNAIDYSEEHLIRRNSLKRLINRQIKFLGEKDPLKISETVIYEFIRAKYLPNDTLPENDIENLAIIIAKHLMLLRYVAGSNFAHPEKIADWVLDLLVCEIDEFLFPNVKELAIADFMYGEMIKTITFTKTKASEEEKQLQIYIAILKNLLKADRAFISYQLLKLRFSGWQQFSPEQVKAFSANLLSVKQKIDKDLNHPYSFQLTNIIKTQAVFFNILRQTIEQNADTINTLITDEAEFSKAIKTVAENNYKKIRSKLLGSIIRVIIYIFFTKTILAFILELPYDQFIVGHINWNALITNIAFHPLLMAIVALSIKVPGPKNTALIENEIQKIVYGRERKLIYKNKLSLRRGSFSFVFFNLIYFLMFGISFGFVIWGLHRLGFNLFSGALFVFFLTLVSFFGFRLRAFANQYLVIPRKENLRNFLIDFFTLPIIRVGKMFSENFSKVNIFIYILDFIIETPLKMLIELLEKALSFISEKREEIS